jgi:hypothetical protein
VRTDQCSDGQRLVVVAVPISNGVHQNAHGADDAAGRCQIVRGFGMQRAEAKAIACEQLFSAVWSSGKVRPAIAFSTVFSVASTASASAPLPCLEAMRAHPAERSAETRCFGKGPVEGKDVVRCVI